MTRILSRRRALWRARPPCPSCPCMAGFPAYGTPEPFKGFVDGQIALWKGVIDKEGLKLDVN